MDINLAKKILNIKENDNTPEVIRTLLAINEEEKSIIYNNIR